MNQDKIRVARYALIAAGFIQLASAVYAGIGVWQVSSLAPPAPSPLVMAMMFPIVYLVAVVVTLDGLKKENPYFWIVAVCLAVISLWSFAFPAGVIAGLALLDKRVRSPFLEKLDFQL